MELVGAGIKERLTEEKTIDGVLCCCKPGVTLQSHESNDSHGVQAAGQLTVATFNFAGKQKSQWEFKNAAFKPVEEKFKGIAKGQKKVHDYVKDMCPNVLAENTLTMHELFIGGGMSNLRLFSGNERNTQGVRKALTPMYSAKMMGDIVKGTFKLEKYAELYTQGTLAKWLIPDTPGQFMEMMFNKYWDVVGNEEWKVGGQALADHLNSKGIKKEGGADLVAADFLQADGKVAKTLAELKGLGGKAGQLFGWLECSDGNGGHPKEKKKPPKPEAGDTKVLKAKGQEMPKEMMMIQASETEGNPAAEALKNCPRFCIHYLFDKVFAEAAGQAKANIPEDLAVGGFAEKMLKSKNAWLDTYFKKFPNGVTLGQEVMESWPDRALPDAYIIDAKTTPAEFAEKNENVFGPDKTNPDRTWATTKTSVFGQVKTVDNVQVLLVSAHTDSAGASTIAALEEINAKAHVNNVIIGIDANTVAKPGKGTPTVQEFLQKATELGYKAVRGEGADCTTNKMRSWLQTQTNKADKGDQARKDFLLYKGDQVHLKQEEKVNQQNTCAEANSMSEGNPSDHFPVVATFSVGAQK